MVINNKSSVNRISKKIAFEFVLEALISLDPIVKPMFGCHAIYVEEKIIFILRNRESEPYDNGVWLATSPQYHTSLERELPSMRSIKLFGGGKTKWQNIPMEADDFEESVFKACEMMLNRDIRIGKFPNT